MCRARHLGREAPPPPLLLRLVHGVQRLQMNRSRSWSRNRLPAQAEPLLLQPLHLQRNRCRLPARAAPPLQPLCLTLHLQRNRSRTRYPPLDRAAPLLLHLHRSRSRYPPLAHAEPPLLQPLHLQQNQYPPLAHVELLQPLHLHRNQSRTRYPPPARAAPLPSPPPTSWQVASNDHPPNA